MIDTDKIQSVVPKGLSIYTGVPVIQSNQDVPPSEQPDKPYLVYTVITLESQNNGTFGEYEDGIDRKPVTQTWSITALGSTASESVQLANKAKDWLERVGTIYLNDRDVIVQNCTGITNRDTVLGVGYEYRNGFEVVCWGFTEIENPLDESGEIDGVVINDNTLNADDQPEKVNVYQGREHAGKILGIDNDGKVTPIAYEPAAVVYKSWSEKDI